MKEPKFARLMNKLIGGLEDRDCKAEADSLGRILNRRGHWRMTTCKNAEIKHEKDPDAETIDWETTSFQTSEPPEPPWRPKVGEHVMVDFTKISKRFGDIEPGDNTTTVKRFGIVTREGPWKPAHYTVIVFSPLGGIVEDTRLESYPIDRLEPLKS